MEIRATVVNLLEIKTMAGFLNYKICRLNFFISTPLDAISQFRKHIDIFRNKTEPLELEFEHAAWLSKQYAIFGELFEQAIMAGLVPSQIQHPGYYYYEAALQTSKRRLLAQKLLSSVNIDENRIKYCNELLSSREQMEFFGQRPWRPGCQSKLETTFV